LTVKLSDRQINTLRRRLQFLQAREYENSYDKAEISALTAVIAQVEQTVEPGRRVVCAAIKLPDVDTPIIGPRHYDAVMHDTIILEPPELIEAWRHEAEQGFIDQHGHFLTREEAWSIAEAAGQIIRRVIGDGQRLYSENLY
jgi:hypothetical protein